MLDALKRIGLGVLAFPFDRPLPPPTPREVALCDELIARLRSISLPSTACVSPSEAKWTANAKRLRELVLEKDPREFLRWDVIRATMFVSAGRFIGRELAFLKSRPDWELRWRNAIQESRIGRPMPYPMYPSSSGTLIQHAYHLAQFEEATGSPLDEFRFIFEFGGGYGSMCRLCHKLGFSGRYLMFDLPHFSAMQQYFLKALGMPVQSADAFRASKSGIFCVSSVSELQAILSSEDMVEKSLFLATWSLSEAPVALRQQVLHCVDRCAAFLIAYQHLFHEVDNSEFFGKWMKELSPAVAWTHRNIENLPGNSYLMGRRSS